VRGRVGVRASPSTAKNFLQPRPTKSGVPLRESALRSWEAVALSAKSTALQSSPSFFGLVDAPPSTPEGLDLPTRRSLRVRTTGGCQCRSPVDEQHQAIRPHRETRKVPLHHLGIRLQMRVSQQHIDPLDGVLCLCGARQRSPPNWVSESFDDESAASTTRLKQRSPSFMNCRFERGPGPALR
jgi:hypothetical protein